MTTQGSCQTYDFQTYREASKRLVDAVDGVQVQAACEALESVYWRGGTVFACGNGGSAATASHFVEDLAKLMWRPAEKARLKAHCLSDPTPFILALANDDGYEKIFSSQLSMQASAGDVVVCISGSGNSPNVVRAARWAKENQVVSLGLTGYNGGLLAETVDINIHVASNNMGMLECTHMLILDFVSKDVRHRVHGVAHAER